MLIKFASGSCSVCIDSAPQERLGSASRTFGLGQPTNQIAADPTRYHIRQVYKFDIHRPARNRRAAYETGT